MLNVSSPDPAPRPRCATRAAAAVAACGAGCSCRCARCSCSGCWRPASGSAATPTTLPSPVRDALVSDDDSAVYDEAADIIQDDYYRKVDRKQLLNKALGSAVDSLDDRFSAYFDPKAYRSFQEATQGAFEGVGMNVEEVPRGLRVLTVFKGSPAAEGGLEPGDEIIAVNGTRCAARPPSRPPRASRAAPARR